MTIRPFRDRAVAALTGARAGIGSVAASELNRQDGPAAHAICRVAASPPREWCK
jgi:hypothetical protein